MTPEIIYTVPRAASWNYKGEEGFLDWNFEGMWGWRGSALNFQRGKTPKSLLEIAESVNFSKLKGKNVPLVFRLFLKVLKNS